MGEVVKGRKQKAEVSVNFCLLTSALEVGGATGLERCVHRVKVMLESLDILGFTRAEGARSSCVKCVGSSVATALSSDCYKTLGLGQLNCSLA